MLNSTGTAVVATALQAQMIWAQLHSEAAGDGTDNVCVTPRMSVYWSVPSSGTFGLLSPIRFIGGVPGDPVYSVSLWDQETDGSYFGEFVVTGDGVFNNDGVFLLTALDFTVTVSGA